MKKKNEIRDFNVGVLVIVENIEIRNFLKKVMVLTCVILQLPL